MTNYSKNGYLSASEFAKLVGTSRQTLIYYDSENILPPSFRDNNGYRYYDYKQIDLIVTIQALQAIGLTIKEIRSYMKQRNAKLTYELFNSQVEKLIRSQKEMAQIIEMMKIKCELIEKASLVTLDMVYVEYHPASLIVKSEYIPFDSDTASQYRILSEHLKYRRNNNYHCGREIAGMANWRKIYENKEKNTHFSYYYTMIDTSTASTLDIRDELDVKPAGNYLVVYHKGPYIDTYKVYSLFVQYAEMYNLELDAYSYEESLIDEITEASPENYINQISIGFTKK